LVRITSDPIVMGHYLAPKWVISLGILGTIIVVSASMWFVFSAF